MASVSYYPVLSRRKLQDSDLFRRVLVKWQTILVKFTVFVRVYNQAYQKNNYPINMKFTSAKNRASCWIKVRIVTIFTTRWKFTHCCISNSEVWHVIFNLPQSRPGTGALGDWIIQLCPVLGTCTRHLLL